MWVLVWGRRDYIVSYVHIEDVVETGTTYLQEPLSIYIQDAHIMNTRPKHIPYPVHAL